MYELLLAAARGLATELPANLVAAAVIWASGAVVQAWRRRTSKSK